MLHNGNGERIRLHGVDCPEKRQPFGNRAKQFTSTLVFGTTVTVQVVDRDRYGRTVGEVLLPDGRSLNRELVKAGFAWWYRRYARTIGRWRRRRKKQGGKGVGYGSIHGPYRLGNTGSCGSSTGNAMVISWASVLSFSND